PGIEDRLLADGAGHTDCALVGVVGDPHPLAGCKRLVCHAEPPLGSGAGVALTVQSRPHSVYSALVLDPLNLTVDVPARLAQVFQHVALVLPVLPSGPRQVLHSVAAVERQVLGDVDDLSTVGELVVRRVVHHIHRLVHVEEREWSTDDQPLSRQPQRRPLVLRAVVVGALGDLDLLQPVGEQPDPLGFAVDVQKDQIAVKHNLDHRADVAILSRVVVIASVGHPHTLPNLELTHVVSPVLSTHIMSASLRSSYCASSLPNCPSPSTPYLFMVSTVRLAAMMKRLMTRFCPGRSSRPSACLFSVSPSILDSHTSVAHTCCNPSTPSLSVGTVATSTCASPSLNSVSAASRSRCACPPVACTALCPALASRAAATGTIRMLCVQTSTSCSGGRSLRISSRASILLDLAFSANVTCFSPSCSTTVGTASVVWCSLIRLVMGRAAATGCPSCQASASFSNCRYTLCWAGVMSTSMMCSTTPGNSPCTSSSVRLA